jgi:hypothetical protein
VGKRDIHDAARKHRDAQAAIVENNVAKQRRKPKHQAALLAEALGEAGRGKWLTTTALIVGLLGPMVLGILVIPRRYSDNLLVMLGEVVFLVVPSMLGLYNLAEWWLANMRLRELRQIGRGFKLEPYLQALRENRHSGTLIAYVGFAAELDAATRDAIPDAVHTWWPDVGSARWQDAALVLESKSLSGTEMLSGETSHTRVFNNREFHTAFLAVIHRVLPELGVPIASFRVEVTGKTSAWDADA